MKYPYIVIANGKWYAAGEDVPVEEEVVAPVSEEVQEEIPESHKDTPTREEIEGMKYFSLKSLAEKNGIETGNKKAAVLKKELIERLGL